MFWKNVVLYETYRKKITVTEYFLHVSVYNVWTKKANKTLGFLRRYLNISSPSVKEQTYKSITRPPLDHEYACTAGDPTIKGKSVNSEWSDAGLKGSSSTDSETHLVLMTCYNTWTAAVLKTGVKMTDLQIV